MEELINSKKIKSLTDVAVMAVGYIMGKEGIDAMPVYPLSKALLECGVDSSHLRNIVKHHESKIASMMTPTIKAVD